MLVPYMRKNNSVSNYNPFRSFDDFERAFWNDNSLEAFHTDIVDNGSEFVLEADLPGFKKEDIHVDLRTRIRRTVTSAASARMARSAAALTPPASIPTGSRAHTKTAF